MQTTSRVQSLFGKTKPVCFARFLIDVPVTAEVVYGRMTVDMEIFRSAGMGSKLNDSIAAQIENDKDKHEIFFGDGKMDKLAAKPMHGPRNGYTQLVSIAGIDKYSIRTYRRLNDDIYELLGNNFSGREVQAGMEKQARLVQAIHLRRDDEIPDSEGICLDGAFIPANPRYENIQLGVRLAEFPDVHLSIYVLKNDQYVAPESYFWRRFKDAEQLARAEGHDAWYESIRLLRKGNKQAGIWSGVELLARLPPQPNRKGSDYHQFMFQAGGKENDRFYPNADIQLDTGVSDNTPGKVAASLTDDELIAVWDKLLSSIRVRETNQKLSTDNRVGGKETM